MKALAGGQVIAQPNGDGTWFIRIHLRDRWSISDQEEGLVRLFDAVGCRLTLTPYGAAYSDVPRRFVKPLLAIIEAIIGEQS
jgi:hypothetical protein